MYNSNHNRIKIIVAEEHQFIRKGLADLIDNDKECKVVAEVGNGSDLICEYFTVNPDLIVVNLILPHMNGIEAVEAIRQRDRSVKVLFMSSHWDELLIYHVYRCGGMGYLYNGENSRNVLNSIKEIHSGDCCFPDNLDTILTRYSKHKEYTGYENHELNYILSKREYEIFILCGNGLTSREISDKLLISMKTVEFHLNNLREKLNLSNRNQLISISARHNLLYGKI